MQGGVISVVTKQGSERFVYDASYYGQAAALTSQPVTLSYLGSEDQQSGYGRARYQDFTTRLGGPAVRDRLWFFGGYQRLRDHDSQPGTDPELPRAYEMQKVFAKLTWRLAPGWQLVQSFHDEIGFDPEATDDRHSVRGDGTDAHLGAGDDLRQSDPHDVGQYPVGCSRRPVRLRTRDNEPSTGSLTTPSRFDRVTGVTTGAPPHIGSVDDFPDDGDGDAHPLPACPRAASTSGRSADNSNAASTTRST